MQTILKCLYNSEVESIAMVFHKYVFWRTIIVFRMESLKYTGGLERKYGGGGGHKIFDDQM